MVTKGHKGKLKGLPKGDQPQGTGTAPEVGGYWPRSVIMIVDNASVRVEGCGPMFAVLRSLAPAVLLLALLSGQAATGMVLAHVASDHAVRESHEEHRAADSHAAHHQTEPDGEHRDAEHGSEHNHQIIPATAAAPARIASPSIDVQPCLAVVGQGWCERPAASALNLLALPVLRAGPPEPQRHPILLL